MATEQAHDSPTISGARNMKKSEIREIAKELYALRTQNFSLAASQRNDDAQSEESATLKVKSRLYIILLFLLWRHHWDRNERIIW